jgi:peptidase E
MGKYLLLSNHQIVAEKLVSLLGASYLTDHTLFLPYALNCFDSNPWLEVKDVFLRFGVTSTEPSSNAKKLADDILTSKAVYICGGNTFFLMQKLRELKLDVVLQQFIEAGGLIIGESAGAAVLGPSIEWVRHLDSLNHTPDFTDFRGLGFLDFIPVPHFGLESYQEHFLTITKELMENSSPFIPIQDGEMVTLEDDSFKYIRDAK